MGKIRRHRLPSPLVAPLLSVVESQLRRRIDT